MFKIVITSLFLERFRPNFRTSFSINKSITHNQIFPVSKNLKKKLSETWQTCPRESGPGGASAQSRNWKIWCNIPNECVRKIQEISSPHLKPFSVESRKTSRGCRFNPLPTSNRVKIWPQGQVKKGQKGSIFYIQNLGNKTHFSDSVSSLESNGVICFCVQWL